jgi:hypothetical protein
MAALAVRVDFCMKNLIMAINAIPTAETHKFVGQESSSAT